MSPLTHGLNYRSACDLSFFQSAKNTRRRPCIKRRRLQKCNVLDHIFSD